jgi:alkylhydroperoxidase family enzyme
MPGLSQVVRGEAHDQIVITMNNRLFGDRDPLPEPETTTGPTDDWWKVFSLVPDVLRHGSAGFALYQSPSRFLPPELRKLGQTRAGWLSGSQFVSSQHCKFCRALGVSEEKIFANSDWQTSDAFSPIERGVMAHPNALIQDPRRVGDVPFYVLTAFLSDEQILELTYITAMYEMHDNNSRALRFKSDDVAEPEFEVAALEGSQARDIGADVAAPFE